jgi:hypothetical protein
MRHENGNCLVAGGFCTAVDTTICEKLHNAYDAGKFYTMEEMKKQGYRKQSGWISVEERLPEKAGRYLVYGVIGGQPLVCGAHYDKYNGFGDDDFTHWMPLPEPPKGEKHDPA